jgi:DNA-binding PadR family transcriptional regulator
MIGEFEYLLLAATRRLENDAYGASIAQEIEATTGRRCSLGALYTTLDRLEAKGLVKTRMGDPTPERGGRAKRIVTLTAAGKKAASEFYTTITTVTEGIAWSGAL